MRARHQPVADMPLLDAFIEMPRLVRQRHRAPFDKRNAFTGLDPDFAGWSALVHVDVADLVVEQPTAAIEILPALPAHCGARIEARRALIAAEPDGAGFFAREEPQA